MSHIERLIEGRSRDLGDGFTVRRVLPASGQPMVGPFVFFDHMGPVDFPAGPTINVRPHPHVALATVTYLFDGEILHRDSLGFRQEIHPGDVNWMVAGRGIVHSERTTPRSLGAADAPARHPVLGGAARRPRGRRAGVPPPSGRDAAAAADAGGRAAVRDRRRGLRAALAGGDGLADAVRRRCAARGWQLRAAGGSRGTRGLCRRRRRRDRRRAGGCGPARAAGARRDGARARDRRDRGARDAGRRRAVPDAAPPVVELRRPRRPGASRRPRPRWGRRDRDLFPDVPGDEQEFIPLPDTAVTAPKAPSGAAPN